MRNDRMQRTLLRIGRTAPLHADMRFRGDGRLEHLHEPGFANTRFATEHHHLPQPVSRLCPAGAEQREFRLSPHQRGEATWGHHVQATLRPTEPQDLIGQDGGLESLEGLRAQRLTDHIALH
jgi:hypothetical protein